MQLLTSVLPTLLAAVLVVLVPGAALLAWSRVDQVIAPPLVPAAAMAFGMGPLALATGVTLGLHQPIVYVAVFMALVTLSAWAELARRFARETRTAAEPARIKVSRVRAWGTPLRWLVAGDWARAIPVGVWLVALGAAMLAFLSGFYAWNDSLYHMGQAQKLLVLDHPTFSNTLQFRDGTAHPGYLLPVWHETVALVSYVARVNVVEAAWIIPVLTVPIAALSMAGLGWTMFRARGAATVTALAWVLAMLVATMPSSEWLFNALHPGHIALDVFAPLVFAMLFTALWPGPPVRDRVEVAPRVVTRAATALAMLVIAEMAILHVSYLIVVALGMLGYLAVWALRAPWAKVDVARHARVFACVAVVAVIGVGILLPGLNDLGGLGRDAKQELASNDSDLYEGKLGADLDSLLRGNPDGAYHLRADYLVLAGGLSLLGLLSSVLVLAAPRWPGGWYLAGTACLVLVIALVDRVFPHYVKFVSLDQARRIERALPLAVGLATGALAVGALSARLWARGAAMRALGVAVATAATAGVWLVADQVPFLQGYGGDQIVRPRIIVLVMAALLLGAATYALLLVVRLVRAGGRDRIERALRLASWEWPTHLITGRTTVVAVAVLLVGAGPLYAGIGDAANSARIDKLPLNQRAGEMRFFSTGVARELRELPVGSVVLGDPRNRDIYTAMAIAPVYVVSSVPRHTADTPKNRVRERFDIATAFFSEKDAKGHVLTDRERLQLLLDNNVDAVIIHPKGYRPAIDLLLATPGITKVARGINQNMFLVDRKLVAKMLAKQ